MSKRWLKKKKKKDVPPEMQQEIHISEAIQNPTP